MSARRIKLGLIVAVLTSALICVRILVFPKASEPRNVLLLTIDTLRADHLSYGGYGKKITPNLDRLAAGGVFFENAFSVMPETIPSHGSIFFGTWPRIHGSLGNDYNFSNKRLAFLPKLLQDAGYSTAAFLSRYHLARAIYRIPGFTVRKWPRSREKQPAPVALDQAWRWISGKKPQKFFVWIHLWDPHSPYLLHPEFMQKIRPEFQDNFKRYYGFFAKGSQSSDTLSKMIDLYDNEISYLDFHVGLFLERLRRESILENTMIIITSDHGETLDELAPTENYAFSHGEFLYDSQLHVPLIVVLPNKQEKGIRIQRTVTLLDIMPTILEWVGLPIPETIKGSSLLSSIQRDRSGQPSEIIFFQRRKYTSALMPADFKEDQFSAREKDFKLLYNVLSGQIVLYRNFKEGIPVYGKDQLKELLKEHLESWLSSSGRQASKTSEKASPEDIEELRALGYIQ